MTEASRLNEDARGSGSNVLRPAIGRWMPGWIIAFRGASKQSSKKSATGEVHVLAVPDSSVMDHVEKLREQEARLVAEVAEWTKRCQSVETILLRAREQMNQAMLRLTSAGESVPDDSSGQLSALQESYQNFAMTTALQEQKMSHATYKVTSIRRQRANLRAEISSVSQNLSHNLAKQAA